MTEVGVDDASTKVDYSKRKNYLNKLGFAGKIILRIFTKLRGKRNQGSFS